MLLSHLAILAFIGPLATVPSTAFHAGSWAYERHSANGLAVVADSGDADTAVVSLTPEVMQRFIAVRKELDTFWHAHADTLDSLLRARRSMWNYKSQDVDFITDGTGKDRVQTRGVLVMTYGSSDLSARIPAVVPIFTAHQFPPLQFAPTTIAILKALNGVKFGSLTTVDSSTVAGKNMLLVRQYRTTLEPLDLLDATPFWKDNYLNPNVVKEVHQWCF